jgi:hypothetical protein
MIFFFLSLIFFTDIHGLTCNSRTCLNVVKVKSGDSLISISQNTGIPSATLNTCNPELISTTLYVDQLICTSCSIQAITCYCSKTVVTTASDTWLSIANAQKMTIGYISDCNPNKVGTSTSPQNGTNICVLCRYSGKKFIISPYYEVVVSLNDNIGKLSNSTLKAVSFAFVTGAGNGNASVASWEFSALTAYSPIVNGFSGIKTISFGGSQQEVELAIKFSAAGATAADLANQYKSLVQAYGSNITLDFDVEGNDIYNTAANDLRTRALKLVKATYPGVKVTYTLAVAATGLLKVARSMIYNSIINGLPIYAVNIMTMNYGASDRGIDYDVKAIEQSYLQLLSIDKSIKMGITPMIGLDDSGARRTVSDIDMLLRFATSKRYIYQFGYWAYHRDLPGTVGISPCLTLAYCAGITGFSKGDYKKKFMAFST